VDGGGSSCRVAIARPDGSVVATATGAAANPANSLGDAISALLATLKTAQNKAGINNAKLEAANAHLGLAGAINKSLADKVARAMPMRSVVVTDDRPTSIAGALGAGDGFVAAIGTGSFVGRQLSGDQSFVGGWGLKLGDEASGAWLGKCLLSRVLHWRDGLYEGSDLLRDTFSKFGDDAGEIVFFANDADPPSLAELAPDVVDAARSKDRNALVLMRDGADYIETALAHLEFADDSTLCLIGGVGPHYRDYLDQRYTRNLVEPRGSALDGALALAARRAGPAKESAA